MKTIWKYKLSPDATELEIPGGSTVLSVDEQFGNVCLWVEVDTENRLAPRVFETFGTGHPIYTDMGITRKFIGSVKLMDGALIFHVYERL